MDKKKKLIIAAITIMTILFVVGFSYAFFTANNVEGNSTTNTIVTLTADYGNVIVTYHNSNGTINTGNMDLKQSETGTHKEYLMRFKIQNTANIIHDISINWSNVTSNFCQYQNNNICTNNNTHKYVGDELNYSLYECPTETLYNNATLANVYSTCKIAGTPYRSVPLTGETLALQDSKKISLSPESTKYYVFVLRMENLNKNQNYQQERNFSGKINVDYADGWEEDCETNPNRLNCQIITRSNPVSDAVASTYVTSASGINFGAISSLTNGQGLYRNYKLEDGENYYFRGGSFCAYTGYETEGSYADGTQCTVAGGTWTNYTCSYDLSKSACEGAGFTWHELNNNVKFADKYWKIIRIDEQGNIRLLYNGNATNATGANAQYGTSAFNSLRGDVTYVGYMNGANIHPTYTEGIGTWTNLNSHYTYTTGSVKVSLTYDFDDETGMFTLTNPVNGYYTNDYTNYYTCLSSATTCSLMVKILVGEKVNTTYYLRSLNTHAAYYTESIEEATNNDNDSTIKGVVDNFYNTILGSYANKIADVGYCGDRSIRSGNGFGRSGYFGGYNRLYTNKTPTYKCQNSNDLYTTKTSLVGNKVGTYPIGLLAVDEVAYAGSVRNVRNYTYYMQSGVFHWTMSPYNFNPPNMSFIVWRVDESGSMNYNGANCGIGYSYGVRPTVSLKSETAITSGTGTLTDPYIIE